MKTPLTYAQVHQVNAALAHLTQACRRAVSSNKNAAHHLALPETNHQEAEALLSSGADDWNQFKEAYEAAEQAILTHMRGAQIKLKRSSAAVKANATRKLKQAA